MTPEDMQELKEAAEKATPGPWVLHKSSRCVIAETDKRPAVCDYERNAPQAEADCRYISLSNPQSILSLITDNERMRAALKPFAKASMSTQDYPDAAACLRFAFDWHDKQENTTRSATVGDLRSAAKAYKGE